MATLGVILFVIWLIGGIANIAIISISMIKYHSDAVFGGFYDTIIAIVLVIFFFIFSWFLTLTILDSYNTIKKNNP